MTSSRPRGADPARLVRDVVEGARGLAERKGVVLEHGVLEPVEGFHGDPDALDKVLVNLVGNALKFTEPGGRIDLSVRREADGVHMMVADTGVGIPRDKLERIFDRFAQVDDSATRRHEGSHFETPAVAPRVVVEALERVKEPVLSDEVGRDVASAADGGLADHLTDANWSLVLPVISEDGVIALIALGPKLSGDPFYPQDLDLLMTLANQAGIAIKNARLYAQVVLANEYIENIVATIESGVVAISADGDHSRARLVGGREFFELKALAVWEAMLPAERFLRVHRSHIVNWTLVERVRRSSGGRWSLEMRGGGAPVPVGRSYQEAVKNRLNLRGVEG